MQRKKYNQIRAAVAVFVGMIVATAVGRDSYVLATVGILAGMAFIILVRSRAKIRMDEREVIVRAKAAQLTYAIFAPTIAIGALLIMLAPDKYAYTESLGMMLAYLALFLIALYAVAFYCLNRQYGGGPDEE